MPQTGQSGSIKAPESRAALDALIAQRNELSGQLRALEDRRYQLADQRARMDGTLAGEVDRRIKTLDGSIDRVERQLARANEFIAAGHGRFGGVQMELPPPPGADVALPPIPPIPPIPPSFPMTEVPPPPPGTAIGRALVLEGVGFLLLGVVVWVWATRRFERRLAQRTATAPGQMTQLQQSVDAIALEVERISENQRWVTKQINERALGGGEAQPVKAANAEPVRVPRER